MAEELSRLESPIDVMSLMHDAFRALSGRAEKLASQLEEGGDLTEFREIFQVWAKQILYHAAAEDAYMTAPLEDCQPARDNESEHAELAEHGGGLIEFMDRGDSAGLEEMVRAAAVNKEQERHQELVDHVKEVEAALEEALGKDRVAARTRRHLHRRMVALRILEYDHFENEEAFVCSLVRERMTENEQLTMVRHFLMDETAENPRWIIDWVADELAPRERRLLADLEAWFSQTAIKSA